MSQIRWTSVDHYINDLFIPKDDALEQANRSTDEARLPPIQITPVQGKLLYILARSIRAHAILEIGTLAAYSTIWLARALAEGGSLVTLEADPRHAAIARRNIDRAGLSGVVQIIEGRAMDSLPRIAASGKAPFDFVFIDADKENNAAYFQWTLKLTRPGSLIVVDNVVRGGDIVDPEISDSGINGVRRFHEELSAEQRVTATIVQTVGSKGYDGFTIALVTESVE